MITPIVIVLHTKEWWDKSAGNTYFASQMSLFDKDGYEVIIPIPFQSGYGRMDEQVACKVIQSLKLSKTGRRYNSLSTLCRENGITLKLIKHSAKKKDCEVWGKDCEPT